MQKVSEQYMGDSFFNVLRNSSNPFNFPTFVAISRETICPQGIADFVTLSGNYNFNNVFNNFIGKSQISIDTCTNILGSLQKNSPRTLEYICKNTGYSPSTTKKILSELDAHELVSISSSGSYTVNFDPNQYEYEIWAFELKLSNWKRALFQALQYKVFAHRVYIVLPFSKKNIAYTNIDIFKTHGIGLMLFDPDTEKYQVICKAKKNTAISKRYLLYSLGSLSYNL